MSELPQLANDQQSLVLSSKQSAIRASEATLLRRATGVRLIGLAINGGIIVLSALKANQLAVLGDREAIVLVVMDSTRHIVSTTVTTIGGFLPLILSGGQFWPPLAMSIAGGVAGSAILALYLVPAMFTYFSRKDARRRSARAGDELPPAVLNAPPLKEGSMR